MRELLADKRKRFSYVEMKFFSMWWELQTEEMKESVRGLVREGRLELLNAGWSMEDEACVYYEDMINNMMIGHQFVEREFGIKPRVGWHIDPFGHSNANQRLFAEMGFDAFFIARLDYQDKQKRLKDKTMEFVWRPMWDTLGESAQIFTHALYNHYSAPPGFDFDMLADEDPFITNQKLTTYNAPEKAMKFHEWIMEQRRHYTSNNILITMGDDFRFQNAAEYFKSSGALIEYYNEHVGKDNNIELIYSTPSMYIDAVNAEGLTYTTKYDDMFPYADNDQSYWTGFFTSRANDKEYIRRAEHTFHASNKLFALNSLNQEVTSSSDFADVAVETKYEMMDVVGVTQHHDAATGTGKQHVANDYARLIFD
jgi:lysosomal alpha-mannosidase